ncbi:MAG: hypothetical protein LBU81_05625 [Methanosarcinales archaeon]|jgi:hypothetical protein|nr:hypothetical protein [Methanosarcinales archaeon]
MAAGMKEYSGDFIAANGLFEEKEKPVLPEVTVTLKTIKDLKRNENALVKP